jgi:hypothetical protein
MLSLRGMVMDRDHMKTGLTILLVIMSLPLVYAQRWTVPEMTTHKPEAGRRVKVIPEAYRDTDVYYSLYLPENYEPGKKYPVIVEYTGNRWAPGGSTGEVKDASLGFAIAKSIEAIWVVFPYIQDSLSVTTWWGDEEETVEFALSNIRKICMDHGGDPAEVFICGFSRGAIGVNYLGLHNEQIADVWLGFFTHDHYDGVREWKGTDWGTPLNEYRKAARERFYRLKGRNCLISENIAGGKSSYMTRDYITEYHLDSIANIQYNFFSVASIIPEIPSDFIPHIHTDKWLLYESDRAEYVFDWFAQTIEEKPGTYSISGVVRDTAGNPVGGIVVESGRTHYAVTNELGEYHLEGLVAGHRKVSVLEKPGETIISARDVYVESNIAGVDFTVMW